MNMEYIRSGKVKDIYKIDNDKILFLYTDRLSSHDVVLADTIPRKGEVLCKLAKYNFENFGLNDIKHNMIEMKTPNSMIVENLTIIPVEVICRNYVYGSYWKRYKRGEVVLPENTEAIFASKIFKPLVEFTTKFEVRDRPITEEEILSNDWLSKEEIASIKKKTLKINELIMKDCERAGLLLADFKLEYGRRKNGEIILADEVGTPDTCRFWNVETYKIDTTQPSLDKQIVRDYLENEKNWATNAPEAGTKLKEKILPNEIIDKTSKKYIEVYERLTGLTF